MRSFRANLTVTLIAFAAVLLLIFTSSRAGDLFEIVRLYTAPPRTSPVVDPFLIDLEERTFRFFWDTANPKNGLIPDRFPTPSFASIAAVGFGLTAYPVGVERGYVTRKDARKRVLTTLRFLRNAPQGHAAKGMTGYKGFFYHFVDMKTGQRFEDSELSTVDTAILLAGALFCQSYFDGSHPEEVEIRRLVDEIYRRVDWQWAQPHAPAISLGWSPEDGFLEYDWRGYNEAMLVYLLALGSPTHPVGPEAWAEWTSTYDTTSWRTRVRPGVPELRAAVRSPVHARVDRLPQAPGRVHAQARPRLFREHATRRLCAAGVCDRQSAQVQGLRRDDLGPHGERRTRGRHHGRRNGGTRCSAPMRRAAPTIGRIRRLHAGAHRRAGLAAVRARNW